MAFLFIPSLASLLDAAERLKGSPLTEEQVLRVRDGANVVITPRDVAVATENARGYAEVDLNDPWKSWQATRQA